MGQDGPGTYMAEAASEMERKQGFLQRAPKGGLVAELGGTWQANPGLMRGWVWEEGKLRGDDSLVVAVSRAWGVKGGGFQFIPTQVGIYLFIVFGRTP